MPRTTLPFIWWPLVDAPTIRLDHCAICGRNSPLNQHHMIKRSARRFSHRCDVARLRQHRELQRDFARRAIKAGIWHRGHPAQPWGRWHR